MPFQRASSDQSNWPVFQRLAVVAATILAGLLACGALLVALGGPVPSALAAPASGPIIYPGGAGCTTTLQACINNAPAGATIVVQAGAYYTNGLTLNKAVSLTGVSSATVLLHALVGQRVLTITGAAVNSSVVISGLTFAGGHAVGGNCPSGCGGAILITATAQPLLINLTISNSRADYFGGGLYADVGSPLVMSGVAVLSNTSSSGGGGAAVQGKVTLTGALFQNNQCTGATCFGGGLFANTDLTALSTNFLSNTGPGGGAGAIALGNVTLTGGLFQNNQCAGANCGGGGGLLANTNVTATNTDFLNNASTSAGGGLRAYGDVILGGGSFQNNQCTGAGCAGGGLFTSEDLALTNTEFMSNTSKASGGGAATRNATLKGAVFQNNQCTEASCFGGGLFATNNLTASNSQFLSNTSADQGGGADAASATLSADVFQNNHCSRATCNGGGLFAGDLTANNSQFLGNTSTNNGGGAIVLGNVKVDGSLFQSNQCTRALCQGGGLVAAGNMAVTDTLFVGNTAQQGAGLFQFSGSGRLVNDLFAANTALSGQGNALLLHSPGAVTLLHTTIASPTVGSGSAVYVTGGTVGLTNTLIASYTVGLENAGGSVFEDYTLFSGVTTHISGTVAGGGHSHTGPAGFLNPSAGDYHIWLGSAAIDTGVNAGITFDIDGDPRPLGNGFDIGYDEANIRQLFLPLVRR